MSQERFKRIETTIGTMIDWIVVSSNSPLSIKEGELLHEMLTRYKNGRKPYKKATKKVAKRTSK